MSVDDKAVIPIGEPIVVQYLQVSKVKGHNRSLMSLDNLLWTMTSTFMALCNLWLSFLTHLKTLVQIYFSGQAFATLKDKVTYPSS